MTYNEVFHDSLATIDRGLIGRMTHASWRSKHPVTAPYFLEYLPLLNASGGVANYRASMAFDSFIPGDGIDGHLSHDERNYLDFLIRYAEGKRCIPILACTRTLGRSKAIRKALPGKSIFLHRNLFHQWASYSSLAVFGNSYFLSTINRTLSGSQHDPIMKLLFDWFGNRESEDDPQCFQLFFLMHLYLYAHAYEAADIVIDTSAIAVDAKLRHAIEDELSSLVSHRIDLSDAREDFGQSSFNAKDIPDFLDTIEQFTKLICGSGISEAAVVFVDHIKQRALEEWQRYEFFTREFRETVSTKTRAAITALEESEANVTVARVERDEYATSLAATGAARDNLWHALASVTAERDEKAAQLVETSTTINGLQQAVAAATAERDENAARLAEIAAAHDGLQHAVAAVTAERDGNASRLAEIAAAHDGLQQAVAAVTAERDGNAAWLAETAAARDRLQQAVNDLTGKLNESQKGRVVSKYLRSVSALNRSLSGNARK